MLSRRRFRCANVAAILPSHRHQAVKLTSPMSRTQLKWWTSPSPHHEPGRSIRTRREGNPLHSPDFKDILIIGDNLFKGISPQSRYPQPEAP